MDSITVYSDGAYSHSRNIGGIGLVFVKDDKVIYTYNKQIKNTTNNRCELSAVIVALHAISKPVTFITIYSDSQYVINTINKGWQRKKNIDLWDLFDKVYKQAQYYCNNIVFEWTKGHADNKFNNLADSLAVEASMHYES